MLPDKAQLDVPSARSGPSRCCARSGRTRDHRSLRRIVQVAATSGLAAGVLAACGGSGSSSPSTTSGRSTTSTSAARTTTSAPSTSTTSSSTSSSTTTTSPGPAPAYEVRTGHVAGLGTVLVNGQGLTLYLFVPDKQSGTSTCYGTCAQAWPPLVLPTGVSSPVAGGEAKSSLLGATHRRDGSVQVTYNKWPLYTWVNDTAPGQATGQGLNSTGGLWYVLSPSGQEITTRP